MRKIFTPLIIAFVLALLSSFAKPSKHVQSASKAHIAAANRTLP
jgi:poly-D-alanine transfer protein DltD